MDMKNNNNSNSHLADWQQGEHSTLSPLDRVKEMQKWLKKNNLEILSKLEKYSVEDSKSVGFVDL